MNFRKHLLIIPFLLCGCKNKNNDIVNPPKYDDYGAFLGRIDSNVDGFNSYTYVSCELDEIGDSNLNRQINKYGVKFLAYLNVGSLEEYRDYYEDFEEYTFEDYENYPDERWIDVTNRDWQDLMVELARGFKERGAFGVYLDNVDVYSLAKENEMNYSAFASSLKSVMQRISALGLRVLVNGGAELFDDLSDLGDNIFNYVWAYHQEEVFSLIEDYDLNIFGEQSEEDKEYYQEIASMMKSKGKEIFFLEYTTDDSLIETIKNYCYSNGYHYYISNNVELI